MQRKRILIFIVILMILTMIFIPNTVHADDLMKEMKEQASSWYSKGEELGKDIFVDENGKDVLQTKFIPIGQVLVAIATIVVIVVTLIMGIKYITANPDEKGKLKQQLIGLVVSIVVIYGAVGIWNLARAIMDSLDL